MHNLRLISIPYLESRNDIVVFNLGTMHIKGAHILSTCIKGTYIILFRFIRVFYGTDNIMQNILHIHTSFL